MNYEKYGFRSLQDTWMSRALWMNESVAISSASNQQQGTLRGVDSDGSLIVAMGDELVHFSGGELSLRGGS
jgi:biotin-(acetyl-CoA carboxylase) ligase